MKGFKKTTEVYEWQNVNLKLTQQENKKDTKGHTEFSVLQSSILTNNIIKPTRKCTFIKKIKISKRYDDFNKEGELIR